MAGTGPKRVSYRRPVPDWLITALVLVAFGISLLLLLAMVAGLGYGAWQVLR